MFTQKKSVSYKDAKLSIFIPIKGKGTTDQFDTFWHTILVQATFGPKNLDIRLKLLPIMIIYSNQEEYLDILQLCFLSSFQGIWQGNMFAI